MPSLVSRHPLFSVLLIHAVLLFSLLLFSLTDLDSLLQDHLLAAGGNGWLIDKQDRLWRWIFYDGVKIFYILLALSCWLAWGLSYRSKRLQPLRWRLLVVALALVLAPVTVGVLKATTEMPCPRQLQQYGGQMPHVTILQRLLGQAPSLKAKCYPAGHASGGFALMSLLFLFSSPGWQRRMIWAGLATGWIIGGYKMAIGDHFFSHTWVTMLWDAQLILLIGWLIGRWRGQSLQAFLNTPIRPV